MLLEKVLNVIEFPCFLKNYIIYVAKLILCFYCALDFKYYMMLRLFDMFLFKLINHTFCVLSLVYR